MYYAKFIEDENRIFAKCNIIRDKYISFEAIYDTGSPYTCTNVNQLNTKLDESKLAGGEVKYIGGLIDSQTQYAKYYKLHVKEFFFGNIPVPNIDLWVTFDDRVTDCIIGLDIISRLTSLHAAYDNRIYFFKDLKELKQHVEALDELPTDRRIKEYTGFKSLKVHDD